MIVMASRPALKLGVLISGSGTNLQAIIDAIERGDLNAQIAVVISNRSDAPGLKRAHRHGLATRVIDHRRFSSREDFDRELVAELKERGVGLVVCAGFMRVLSAVMVKEFPNQIMNIHPSLLPAFRGLDAQKAAVEYGVRIAGCTVHFVDQGVDEGPIIIQAAVPVYPSDTEEDLRRRILEQEHRIYPRAIVLFEQGRLKVVGRRVMVSDMPMARPEQQLIINPPLDK
jgi:phosphoribosylglycinamide formyltransferase-1